MSDLRFDRLRSEDFGVENQTLSDCSQSISNCSGTQTIPDPLAESCLIAKLINPMNFDLSDVTIVNLQACSFLIDSRGQLGFFGASDSLFLVCYTRFYVQKQQSGRYAECFCSIQKTNCGPT